MTYRDILNEDLDELRNMSREALSERLSILNKEANQRLKEWSKAGKRTRELLEVDAFKSRLGSTKGMYIPFRVDEEWSKSKLLNGIIRRGEQLQRHTSKVEWAKESQRTREWLLKEQIYEHTDIDYNQLQTKPSLRKIGKLLTRLREEHYLAGRAGESGFVLGSADVLKEIFEYAIDNPYYSLDRLHTKVKERLDEMQQAYYNKQNRRRRMFRETAGQY